jgi:hypothetical protein
VGLLGVVVATAEFNILARDDIHTSDYITMVLRFALNGIGLR